LLKVFYLSHKVAQVAAGADFSLVYRLADRFHVFGLTRRGFGASDQPEHGYDLTTLAKDIAQVVQALAKLKSYLDYGVFQPIQIAGIIALNECTEVPKQIREIYRSRRDTLCDGLDRIGWEMVRPPATMFAWAQIPESFRHMGSLEFAKMLVRDAKVAVSPGIGFGAAGDEYVRFALVENEQRIRQAIRGIRKAFAGLSG
jgi:aspartate/methionine/tyrosine aminotransferase